MMLYILLGIYLTCMVALVQIKKDNSLGNFAWGGGVLLITWYTFLTGTYTLRSLLITTLVSLWGIRLSIFFYTRYQKGKDPRFQSWQEQWHHPLIALGASLVWIVGLQSFMSLIMSTPSLVVNTSPIQGLNWLDLVGTIGWLSGFTIESISDHQLRTFQKTSTGVMNQGLWRYSRHPNYFGEIVIWWSLFLIALSSDGLISIVAPIAITTTLCFVTGIPMVEAVFKDNPDYQAYAKKTSLLIPWWPK